MWLLCTLFGLHSLSSTLPLGTVLSIRPHLLNFYWVSDIALGSQLHHLTQASRLILKHLTLSISLTAYLDQKRSLLPNFFPEWTTTSLEFHIQNYFQPPILSHHVQSGNKSHVSFRDVLNVFTSPSIPGPNLSWDTFPWNSPHGRSASWWSSVLSSSYLPCELCSSITDMAEVSSLRLCSKTGSRGSKVLCSTLGCTEGPQKFIGLLGVSGEMGLVSLAPASWVAFSGDSA